MGQRLLAARRPGSGCDQPCSPLGRWGKVASARRVARRFAVAAGLLLLAPGRAQGQHSPPDIYESAPYNDDSAATTTNLIPNSRRDNPPSQSHTIDSDSDVDWGICEQSPELWPRLWSLEIESCVIPSASQLLVEVHENGPERPATKALTIPSGQSSGRLSWWQGAHVDEVFCSVRAQGTSSPAMSYVIYYNIRPGATLPVNPVEERSIFIGSTGGRSPADLGSVVLTPGDGSKYPLSRVEFPGYALASAEDSARIEVTIRSATLFERASEGSGQSFPDQSGAVFVIETRNAQGEPIAFTDPVNLWVQYKGSTQLHYTDVVTLDIMQGPPLQMRLARDALADAEVDFQFLDNAHEFVDVSTGIVTHNGLVGLTGPDGLGTWGAAVNPAATANLTIEDLIAHLLGEFTLPQTYHDLVDYNDDDVLDAADVVTAANASFE